ncbi:MAG: 2-C-methyl-D-erythritol 2,4-cyclodiphosphate synthase [Fastidiosipilaceae bacterium]|jgi:2-C-methyl-D-erythritol 2,4-cyclodiphosphate synthase
MGEYFKTAIGQDSHRFIDRVEDGPAAKTGKPLILGGLLIEDEVGLAGNSDSDAVLHALTNAVSGITGINVLGERADELCAAGQTDSVVYLKAALKDLPENVRVIHVSISIEAARPILAPHIEPMKRSLARIMQLPIQSIGITATSGEGLSDYGRGDGIMVTCVISVREWV